MNNKFIFIILQTLSFFFFLGCDQIKSRVNDSLKKELTVDKLNDINDISEIEKDNTKKTIIKKPVNKNNKESNTKKRQTQEKKINESILDTKESKSIRNFNVIGIDKDGPYQSEKVKRIKSNPK